MDRVGGGGEMGNVADRWWWGVLPWQFVEMLTFSQQKFSLSWSPGYSNQLNNAPKIYRSTIN